MEPAADSAPAVTAARSGRPPTPVIHLIESDGVYGAERVVLALARQAASDADFPVTIGCLVPDPMHPHPLADRARDEGLPVIKLQLRRSIEAPVDLIRILLALRRLRAGIVHTHGYKAAIVGYAAHLLTGAPVLATCHGWADDSQVKRTYHWLTHLERRLYRHFSLVVPVSLPIARQLGQWRVPKDRITEVPNGIALPDAPSPAALDLLRRRLDVPSAAFVVLHVGRLSEEKAQADLVEAAGALRGRYPAVRVLILGDGHLRSALEQQIADRGVSDVVTILGFQENVSDYLALADVFALPSMTEGLPISVLEALGAGVPVVCTPVGALPTILQDGVTALFVPVHSPLALAAAIERMIVQPDLRQTLSERGRELVRRSATAEVMYERYRTLYDRLRR